MSEYLAHSKNSAGQTEPLAVHLQAVADRAAEYACAFGAEEEARIAGLLHDLGKYGDRFQDRLKGLESGIDHWTNGAREILKRYQKNGLAASIAVMGHHVGLPSLGDLKQLTKAAKPFPSNLRLSQSDSEDLIHRFINDGLRSGEIESSLRPALLQEGEAAAAMLDLRMLFSALVDADFVETEAHFQGTADELRRYRREGTELRAAEALRLLQIELERLQASGNASSPISKLRADLLKACYEAADFPKGIFTLTAPTGAGKTLAMLAFALKHAEKWDLRRIVVVIPYLSIIEQTAAVYRNLFQPTFGDFYVLEHHSMAGTRESGSVQDNEDEAARVHRLLSENWDAPLVITTSIQMLESLFANRSSACRKLHRLARSVILFDEVQTIPPKLAVPTLATLSWLSERFGGSVVFATATQPAFATLDRPVRAMSPVGWQPREIADEKLNLFKRSKRVNVSWPDESQRLSWDELAVDLAEHDQALCIVNTKRQALDLLGALGDEDRSRLHLSTNMCPAHRERVLRDVHARLENGSPCRLVATQCVEAGVDIDFPVVFRALGPLEAIAQAAGRCNRAGKRTRPGEVRVFRPAEESYPPDVYAKAADCTKTLLKSAGEKGIDIDDPSIFTGYYELLYSLTHCTDNQKLVEAVANLHFPEVARLYRLIPNRSVNILVPFDQDAYTALAGEVRDPHRGFTGDWIRRTRPYTVSVFAGRAIDRLREHVESVPLRRGSVVEDWFIYLREKHYDDLKGLDPPDSPEFLLV